MSDCPVTCPMHGRALRWLGTRDWATLRELHSLFDRMERTAWRACRCRLAPRIRAALADLEPGHVGPGP